MLIRTIIYLVVCTEFFALKRKKNYIFLRSLQLQKYLFLELITEGIRGIIANNKLFFGLDEIFSYPSHSRCEISSCKLEYLHIVFHY